ncbi:3'-5' exonuclease [Alkalimonas sp. NCh-2]|uniref:3'-5' exonuclease n=1 Tax=Alkalimonas sp. NCh-2 TaxID=3144846 RepID=UPI0031F71895
MNNLMIDIETLGTGKNAVIISLGAVFFCPETGNLGAGFYQTITRGSCELYGLEADEDTVRWWSEQSAEARAVLTCPDAGDLDDTLREFAGWLWESTEEGSDIHVWGNGPSFDNAILANAYNRCNVKLPWKFRHERCVRTIVALGRELLGIDPKKTIERKGTHHHALADAEHQALYVSAVYQALKAKVAE